MVFVDFEELISCYCAQIIPGVIFLLKVVPTIVLYYF